VYECIRSIKRRIDEESRTPGLVNIPLVPKTLSSIELPYRLTRTLMDDQFLLCYERGWNLSYSTKVILSKL